MMKIKQRFKKWILSFFSDFDFRYEMNKREIEARHIGKRECSEAKKEMDAYIDSIGGKKVFIEKCATDPLPLACIEKSFEALNKCATDKVLVPLFHKPVKKL